jgi:hypothetical protein
MRKPRSTHHDVEFVQSFATSLLPTFNARTALTRAQFLLADAEHLEHVHDSAREEANRGRIKGFDVTDYFAVGYVTCLEWHARSRLADILTHAPNLIEPKSINALDPDAISQMVAAGATLPDLLAASTKINSLGAYTKVFETIWKALEIATPLKPILTAASLVTGAEESLFQLFPRRHGLVHEISVSKIGSYTQRDTWDFQQAIAHGRMVVDLITRIEAEITKAAPDGFPNKLKSDGMPEVQRDILERALPDLLHRISSGLGPDSETAALMNASSKKYIEEQEEFIRLALIDVPKRYYNPEPVIVDMLYRHQVDLFKAIADELS